MDAAATPADQSQPAAARVAGPTSDTFAAELSRQLAAEFKLEGDLQLELLRPWTAPTLAPAGDWQVALVEAPAVPASTMLIHCRLLSGGAVAGDWTLPVHAQVWRDAWITREPVAHAENFDPAKLDTRRVDLLREREALPASADEHESVFTHAISGGRLLTWHDLSRKALVHKGELVEVHVSEGALLITMKGQALENGARGDTITIRNLESQKNFPALVVEESRVQVRL
jgi:flagella basal body P-ring formation protein FlgA